MHLGVVIPRTGTHDPTDLAISGKTGIRLRLDGELWGSSSVVKLSEIAAKTDEVELGTAIVNVFSRTPAVLAMTAATLDRVSNGRASLGVGTSTPTAVENVHGMPFDRPIRRSHETIEVIQCILGDDEPVTYEGNESASQAFRHWTGTFRSTTRRSGRRTGASSAGSVTAGCHTTSHFLG